MHYQELVNAAIRDLNAMTTTSHGDHGALHELFRSMFDRAHLPDLLRSKLSVKQVLVVLASAIRAGSVAAETADNGPLLRLSEDCRASGGSRAPAALGPHLIATDQVTENPEYRKIATALLEQKKSEFDQSIETYESQTRRFKMMQALGDCHHDKILLLGDDALFSLYLATHGVTSEIWVGDIDTDLLSFIETTAKAHGLNTIHVFNYSVFDPLPDEHVDAFDCVSINGFKDVGGLLTFICRGVQSLKTPKAYRTGYFNFGSIEITDEARFGMDFEIQKFLTRIGLTIEHLTPAPESHIDADISRDLFAIVQRAAQMPDCDALHSSIDEGLEAIKQRYQTISWVAVDAFPDIVLSPLKICQFRVDALQDAEIKRFLRLARMYR